MKEDISNRNKVKKIVYIGLFSSVALILMSTISIPILPNATYLRYDPSEIASIFVAVLIDPMAGVAVCFFKDLLYFFLRAKSIFGPTADFIASSIFTFIVGTIYHSHLSQNKKLLLIMGGLIGTICRIIIIIPINIVILHLQFGFTTKKVLGMLLPVLIPFNSLKSIINFIALYLVIYLISTRKIFVKKFISP